MTAPTVAEMLKYANLQMAAEALYNFKAKTDPNQAPGDVNSLTGHFSNQALTAEILTTGNEHASRFTQTEAEKFAAQWRVVDHISNTTTGFSGTVFIANKDDPAAGIKKDELVLSFRSTEFIDDAARDAVATNGMEITEYGWAFGQIGDMEAWYAKLRQSGLLPADAHYSVTGYSLSGHLATAFNLLRREDGTLGQVDQVVTFNGAGVGQVQGTLSSVMNDFTALRNAPDSIASRFSDARLGALYTTLRERLADGHIPGSEDYALLNTVTADSMATEYQRQTFDWEKKFLREAMDRIKNIKDAVAYLGQVTDTKDGRPAAIPEGFIAQERFEYQMAVLWARDGKTSAKSLPAGAINSLFGKSDGLPPLGNQYDVVGRETTTKQTAMVADSQWHYGANVDLFIEDQPLLRGTVLKETAGVVWDTGAMLPIDNYTFNNFGDTHSLVLIVDSLNVQNTLLKLVKLERQATAAETLNTLFKNASWRKAEANGGTQGQAEGDVLENVVNALADLFLGPQAKGQRLTGSALGNTWAETDATYTGADGKTYSGREALYAKLKAIAESDGYGWLAGKLALAPVAGNLSTAARNDYLAYGALLGLSPVVLSAPIALTEAEQDAAFGPLAAYADWKVDRADVAAGKPPEALRISDQWIADRAAFLTRKTWYNANNVLPDNPSLDLNRERQPAEIFNPYELENRYYEDRASGYVIQQGSNFDNTRRIIFGDERIDTITGANGNDNVYGGAGNDTLSGGAGDDYLEGNAGADSLLGGGDEDILVGGKGDDRLEGGAGDDLYVINSGDGTDTFVDSGPNRVRFNGKLIAGLFIKNETSGAYEYFKDGTQKLEFHSPGVLTLADDTRIVFQEQTSAEMLDGSFGFTLYQESAASATTREIIGDFQSMDFDLVEDGIQTQQDDLGNVILDATKPAPGSDDSFNDSAGNDLIQGMGGNDVIISARGGHDRIEGGDGNDVMKGGDGNDVVLGGAGRDVLVEFGGDDRLYADGVVSIKDALADENAAPTGQQGEALSAGAGDDVAIGGRGEDLLLGGFGDDILIAGAGNDIVEGDVMIGDIHAGWSVTRGADFARTYNGFGSVFWPPGGGADSIFAGAGNDWVFAGNGDDYIDGGRDDDALWGEEGGDDVFGGSGDDALCGDSGLLPPSAHGNDYLDGEAGNDTLWGDGGDDDLFGGEGNDDLIGDAGNLDAQYHGNDTLDGEDGDDSLWGMGGDDSLIGGIGNDTLQGDANDLAAERHGADTLEGGEGNDVLFGDGGADELLGEDGDDLLNGGAGDDYLAGGDNDDVLHGDAGNDTLAGGAGLDLLAGGADDDVYLVERGDGPTAAGTADLVLDTAGNDTLRFGAGIVLADVTASGANQNDLLIEIDTDRLLIQDGLGGTVERFEFADGWICGARRSVRRTFKSQRWRDGNSTWNSANQHTWRVAA